MQRPLSAPDLYLRSGALSREGQLDPRRSLGRPARRRSPASTRPATRDRGSHCLGCEEGHTVDSGQRRLDRPGPLQVARDPFHPLASSRRALSRRARRRAAARPPRAAARPPRCRSCPAAPITRIMPPLTLAQGPAQFAETLPHGSTTGRPRRARRGNQRPSWASGSGWTSRGNASAPGSVERQHPRPARSHSVQNDLFDLGADLAVPPETGAWRPLRLRITPGYVARLEEACDELIASRTTRVLPAPRGHPCGRSAARMPHNLPPH
jgi:hypothetical protein